MDGDTDDHDTPGTGASHASATSHAAATGHESAMVVGGVTVSTSTPTVRSRLEAIGQGSRRGVVAAVIIVVAAAIATVAWLVGRPAPLATIVGGTQTLPAAPTGAVAQRWEADLDRDDQVVLADDTVVVFESPPLGEPDGPGELVAHDLASGDVVWRHRLPADTAPYLVTGDGGLVDALAGPRAQEGPDDRPDHVVALDASDGGTRWRRAATTVVPNVQSGRALVLHDGTAGADRTRFEGCELIESATGETQWEDRAATSCAWTGGDRVISEVEGAWQVRAVEGQVLATGQSVRAPTMVGDLVVHRQGRTLAVDDLAGNPQWDADLDVAPDNVRPLPDGGILATSWNQEGGPITAGFAPDGTPRPIDDIIAESGLVAFDGGSYLVRVQFDQPQDVRVTIDQVTNAGTDRSRVATASSRFLNGPLITDRGALLANLQDAGPRLELAGWPTLDTLWSVELPRESMDDGGVGATVATSSDGLVVVVAPVPGQGQVLYAYG